MIMCEKLLVGSGHKWKLQDGEIEVNEFHDRTRIDLSLSEISDEEVDYDSYASNVDSDIAPDSSWSAL